MLYKLVIRSVTNGWSNILNGKKLDIVLYNTAMSAANDALGFFISSYHICWLVYGTMFQLYPFWAFIVLRWATCSYPESSLQDQRRILCVTVLSDFIYNWGCHATYNAHIVDVTKCTNQNAVWIFTAAFTGNMQIYHVFFPAAIDCFLVHRDLRYTRRHTSVLRLW